jgi:RNA polymerase sigma-70 factor (ECF subfamily)
MQAVMATTTMRGATDALDFDGFYAASYRRVVQHVYAFTGDVGEAQDCAQEAYTKAYLRWSEVSTYDDPAAWVRTVAFRLAVSRWRKTRNSLVAWRRHGTAHVPDLSPDHVALVAALRQISAPQREAIVLHHLVGLSVDEIADQTGTPTGTIKARLARGRAALAALLGPEPTDVPHA